MKKIIALNKWVYYFAEEGSEGRASDKNLLGGKGANLAEMGYLGLPIPPGFTITTEVCTEYFKNDGAYPAGMMEQVKANLQRLEQQIGKNFGDINDPLLVSVRSGARKSMPGMMDTVLNVGLTSKTIKGLIDKTGNPRFAWDCYRRLIMMYADVVMEKAAGIEPEEGKSIRQLLEEKMDEVKHAKGVKNDTELDADDWEKLASDFKEIILKTLNKPFPDDPMEQLYGAIGAVFQSWNGKRAVSYRKIEGIPHDWGTAVNVQAMVFGNMGTNSATGVAFTRNPGDGENRYLGEWLPDAQGEDVVAGIRTPNPISEYMRSKSGSQLPSLEAAMPKIYRDLRKIKTVLEEHFGNMQDIEFTIQDGKLYMLQTRDGKRNGPAAIKIAIDMFSENLIPISEALMRVTTDQLDELLHDMVDPEAEKTATIIGKGLAAGPGGATGIIVFTADEAEAMAKAGHKVILVREETSPEDVHGMKPAQGILTARGGMTSHAALVARGWGKCCIVGCGDIQINLDTRQMTVKSGDKTLTFKQGDWITLNGTKGIVYADQLNMIKPNLEENDTFRFFLSLTNTIRRLGIRTNADTPADVRRAIGFGAEGIGLFRVEHTVYNELKPMVLLAMQKLILSDDPEEKEAALKEFGKYLKEDVSDTLRVLNGLPLTIRLMDPPLHEFLPISEKNVQMLEKAMDISRKQIDKKRAELHEQNPMMGNRGVRLGIMQPEITKMQCLSIFEAAAELQLKGIKTRPEVMVPLIVDANEFIHQAKIIREVAAEVEARYGLKLDYLVGTMIETPRAAITAGVIAKYVDFMSFGTNDLTQMTYGFSRDDVAPIVLKYIQDGILKFDPFQSIDEDGVGVLIKWTVDQARATNPNIKIGICGEQGGDPQSIAFLNSVGLDYVSMSPFRVPIARLAAAQSEIARQEAVAAELEAAGN
ncbi:MAG: pyruvate, phosphate dikinase [Candidatus Margulisbacteria bacterium]|nr:pyruvate, phosphate dikinase [Candidatus Margulisiibacteriota bacterium]